MSVFYDGSVASYMVIYSTCAAHASPQLENVKAEAWAGQPEA